VLKQKTTRNTTQGNKRFLGAVLERDGVNFCVFSKYAKAVYLLLFDALNSDPTDIILLNKTGDYWHVFVKDIKPGQLYGYKASGDYNPSQGMRFNETKLLIDPYAKALTSKASNTDKLLFGYDYKSPLKDLVKDDRENSQIVPKSIVVDDTFDWQDVTSPNVSIEDLIIYETHLKGFTASRSSGVKSSGTYMGFIEKIPYLKDLGVNAVELLPIFEFQSRDFLIERGLKDYWGYNTIGFFAPESSYSTNSYFGCQVQEFKTLVRELHRSGIEIILDVVFNHTGEGDEKELTLCFRGLDNPSYYALSGSENQPYRYYINSSGCGNILRADSHIVADLVIDSLRYWIEFMKIDGFRFDLATILGRVGGIFKKEGSLLERIASDPVISKVKLIAEPWDIDTYQLGNFPQKFLEWNDRFRDCGRKFIRGDKGLLKEVVSRISGSRDIYKESGNTRSINFFTCHDGFTMYDLFSYNKRNNYSNGENNSDGAYENHSYNCGIEGDTEDSSVMNLRKKLIKNSICYNLLSFGVPMILGGDEFLRTQNGNNNAYCQDNDLGWLNWNRKDVFLDVWMFFKKVINLRKKSKLMFSKDYPDFTVFDKEGLVIKDFDKKDYDDNCLIFRFNNILKDTPKSFLLLVFNTEYKSKEIVLPKSDGLKWFLLVDTSRNRDLHSSLEFPEEEYAQKTYSISPQTTLVFLSK